MCGRYALTTPPQAVRELFGYPEQPNFPPRFNISPTQPVAVVTAEAGKRRFRLMRWGFVPGWVKDPAGFPLVINIRGETARQKPSFRAAFMRRRCLMPADGFYEWQRLGRESRAWLFRRPDRGCFAFAALWETWSAPDGGEIDTVALVNGPANGLMSAVHERCPVILPPEEFETWLGGETPAETDAAQALLRPPPEDLLEMVRVGPLVNKATNEGPELQAPWQPEPQADAGVAAPAAKPRRTPPGGDGNQGSLF